MKNSMNDAGRDLYTVGELAKMSGTTIRTLQYYDRSGLLACQHSESGRRLYGYSDLLRLQQILFFKSVGFSLAEIRDRLIDVHSGPELARLLKIQKGMIEKEIENLMKTANRLESMVFEVKDCDEVDSDHLVAIVELAKLSDTSTFLMEYLDKRQMYELIDRFSGDEAVLRDQQKQTSLLFREMLRLYNSGADPEGPEGQRLAERFWQMVMDFSGGKPELIQSFISMGADSANWPEEASDLGEAVGAFLSKAMYAYLKAKGFPLEEFAQYEKEK